MPDAQALKIFEGLWADSGDREDIPVAQRRAGWDGTYSAVGGNTISRARFNQRMRELDGFSADWMLGRFLLWSADIAYPYTASERAFAMHGGVLYVNTRETTNEEPGTAGAPWRAY